MTARPRSDNQRSKTRRAGISVRDWGLRGLCVGLGLACLVALLERLLDPRTMLLSSAAWTIWTVHAGLVGSSMIIGHRETTARGMLVCAGVLGAAVWLAVLAPCGYLLVVSWDLALVESLGPAGGQPLIALAAELVALICAAGLALRAVPQHLSRVRRITEPSAVVIVCLGLAIVGGEAAFRMADQLGCNSWEVYDSPQTRKPGASFIWRGHFGKTNELEVLVTNNQYGYHAPRWSRRRTPDVSRIAVIGDSFVEAYQVRADETFHSRLGVLLSGERNGSARKVEVLGFGHSGIGPVQEARLLEDEVLPFRPDLVLLAFLPSNDVRDAHPSLTQATKQEGRFVLNRGPQYVISRYLGLRFAGHLLWQMDRMLARLRQGSRPSTDSLIFLTPAADQRWIEAWRRVDRAILDMRSSCSSIGATFGVITLTSAIQLEASAATDDAQAKAQIDHLVSQLGPPPAGRWDLLAPDHHVEDLCRAHDIPVLVLNRELARLTALNRSRIHFAADGHWTAYGHMKAAEHIAGHVARHGLIP